MYFPREGRPITVVPISAEGGRVRDIGFRKELQVVTAFEWKDIQVDAPVHTLRTSNLTCSSASGAQR